MFGRGPRCSVCGRRPADPLSFGEVLHLTARPGVRPRYHLCVACRVRNQQGQVAALADFRREVASTQALAAQWLREAPLLEALPAPVGTHDEMFPRYPFVEVMGPHTAAEYIANIKYHLLERRTLETSGSQVLPQTHANALKSSSWEQSGSSFHLYASVYRLPDGDIAVHWHSSLSYPGD